MTVAARERPLLVIRADAGPVVGTGHVARCLALGQAWVDAGGSLRLLADGVPNSWIERYTAEGASLRSASEPDAFHGAAWACFDGYGFTPDDHRIAARAGARVLAIDDHARAGAYAADVVVDQGLGATVAAYDRAAPDAALLLGPEYMLLRRDLRTVRRGERLIPDRASGLIIALGGAPPPAATMTIDAVEQTLAETMDVLRLQGLSEVAPIMAAADLAVSAAGTTSWELAYMGVPSLLVSLADNQRPIAAALAAAGAAVDLGWYEVDVREVVAEVLALAGDRPRRAAMSEAGRALSDGDGASRVVARLLG